MGDSSGSQLRICLTPNSNSRGKDLKSTLEELKGEFKNSILIIINHRAKEVYNALNKKKHNP